MFEEYLQRMYPNMDLASVLAAAERAPGSGRRGGKAADFVPLSAEEKSNICSNELDAIMQSISDAEKKGQDELGEARLPHHLAAAAAQPILRECPSARARARTPPLAAHRTHMAA